MRTSLLRTPFYLAVLTAGCTPTIGDATNDVEPDAGVGVGVSGDAAPCEDSIPISLDVHADPPDVLIVLDRSGSMAEQIGNQSKWNIMHGALATLTAQQQSAIKFGLAMYPSDGNCGSDQVHITAGLGTASAINTKLSQTNPNGNTPTHKALHEARTYFAGAPVNPAGRYVLLATDGLPNCGGGGGDSQAEIQQLAAMGIPTYVIGFGDVSSANPNLLRSWAIAGGTTDFFAATTPATLDQALATISHDVSTPSCKVVLPATTETGALRIVIGGTPIPSDPANGWDYDPATRTVTFHGSSCSLIQSGSVHDIQIGNRCTIVRR